MASNRQVTVLFADVVGSTKLYETAGNAHTVEAISRCLRVLRDAVESAGGRVVKTVGDGVMAFFATPNDAARAAVHMHTAIEALPATGDSKLAARIGFHSGPVIERADDIFGDTVNTASRLLGQATQGQVLTSDETASRLTPILQSSTRRLYSVQLKGKAEKLALCELIWRQSPDVTATAPKSAPQAAGGRAQLRVLYSGREVSARRADDAIVIGRDASCQVVVADLKASRQHCTIDRRQDHFILQDHSANGTFVTVDGEKEIALHREQFTLRKHGRITFGQPGADKSDGVEFFLE